MLHSASMDVPRAIDHRCSIIRTLPLNPLANHDGSAGKTRRPSCAVCGIIATRTVPAEEDWTDGADCARELAGSIPPKPIPTKNASAAKHIGREILRPRSCGLVNRIDSWCLTA